MRIVWLRTALRNLDETAAHIARKVSALQWCLFNGTWYREPGFPDCHPDPHRPYERYFAAPRT